VPLDELQRMFVDSLKKLKARDKRISDLAAAHEAAAAETAALRQQLAARDAAAAQAVSVDKRLEVGAPLLHRTSAPMAFRIPRRIWAAGAACSCPASTSQDSALDAFVVWATNSGESLGRALQAAEAELAHERGRAADAEAALAAAREQSQAAVATEREQSDAALAALREQSEAALAALREQCDAALAAAHEQSAAAGRQLQDARDEVAVLGEQAWVPSLTHLQAAPVTGRGCPWPPPDHAAPLRRAHGQLEQCDAWTPSQAGNVNSCAEIDSASPNTGLAQMGSLKDALRAMAAERDEAAAAAAAELEAQLAAARAQLADARAAADQVRPRACAVQQAVG